MPTVKDNLSDALLAKTHGDIRRTLLKAVHSGFEQHVDEIEKNPNKIRRHPVDYATELVSALSAKSKKEVRLADKRKAVQRALLEKEQVADEDTVEFVKTRLKKDMGYAATAYLWALGQPEPDRTEIVRAVALTVAADYRRHIQPDLVDLAVDLVYDREPAITFEEVVQYDPLSAHKLLHAAWTHPSAPLNKVLLEKLLHGSWIDWFNLLDDQAATSKTFDEEALEFLYETDSTAARVFRAMFNLLDDENACKLANELPSPELIHLLGALQNIDVVKQLLKHSPEPSLEERKAYSRLLANPIFKDLGEHQKTVLFRCTTADLLIVLSKNPPYVASFKDELISLARDNFDASGRFSVVSLQVSDIKLALVSQTERDEKLEKAANLVLEIFPVAFLSDVLQTYSHDQLAETIIEKLITSLPSSTAFKMFLELADSWAGTTVSLLEAVASLNAP